MAKRKNKRASTPKSAHRFIGLSWLILSGAWLLIVASLVSYDPADRPGHAVAPYNEVTSNWVGIVGAWISHKLYLMVGPGVWVTLVGLLVFLLVTAGGRTINQLILRLLGLVMMSVSGSAIIGFGLPDRWVAAMPGAWNQLWPSADGGLLAIYIHNELTVRFGWLGTMIILTIGLGIGAILTADQVVGAVPKFLKAILTALGRLKAPLPGAQTVSAVMGGIAGLIIWPGKWALATGRTAIAARSEADPPRIHKKPRRRRIDDPIDEETGGLGATESFDLDLGKRSRRKRGRRQDEELDEIEDEEVIAEIDDEIDETLSEETTEADGDEIDEADDFDAPGAYVDSRQAFDPDELRAKIKKLPINFAPKSNPSSQPMREVDLSGYEFPSLSLLEEPEGGFTEEMERLVRDQAVALESALQQYRIEGEVVGIDSGPVITLYEVRLAPGTKVASINSISSDLARALRAHNIRVVPNMAGKDTVGIEVPNLKKERVRLKELMTAKPEATRKMKLPMFLGKNASGEPLIADLASMPHMLIAGTTGSGKSVCMNSIIISFLFTKRPDELKLVLVDPKMVEMSMFRDIPHLMCPVVTEMGRASAILEWATTKMDERYELLAEAGVRDIAGYNSLEWEELLERMAPDTVAEEARIPKKLPYLVFVIDELADLMMTNKEVEGFIVRLAQKSRAVGMHLILATQRPQANVVTGLIKSNMPCRVSFKVASSMDSRIVLDQKGAELLLGQGDMLFLHPRTSKLTRAQGTLVDDHEIRSSVKFLKTVAQQNFEPQLVQLKSGGLVDGDEERDPLFDNAVEIIIQTKRGSVSLLQRRLTIGYSRASRLIEQMAQAGIIGEYKGSQAREVNITLEEWDAIKAQAAADAEAGDEPFVTGAGDEEETDPEFDDDADIDAAARDEEEEEEEETVEAAG